MSEPPKKTKSVIAARAAERRKHRYKNVNPAIGERRKSAKLARRVRRAAEKVAAGTWKPYGSLARKMHVRNPNHNRIKRPS